MSVTAMALAWYVDDLTPAQKAVLVALADHADDEGNRVYPSVQRIGIKTSYAERTVRRALADLRNIGLVHIVKEATHHAPTEYRLDLPQMQVMQYRPATNAGHGVPENTAGVPESANRPATNAPKPSYNHQKEPSERTINISSASAEAPPADAKTDWEIWLEALCWVCHGHQNTTALSEKDFNILTAEAKRIKKNGHAQPPLLKRWFVDRWQAENAWKSGSPRPSPYEVRCGLPAQAAAHAEAQEIMEANVQHRRTTSKPAQAVPEHDDPWQTALFDFAQSRQLPDGVLDRARAEVVGEQGEAQVWRITLDPADGAHLDWMQARGLTLIRSTLASVLCRAVLVDVVLPEAEAA
jgi:hypothetical protein